MPKRTTINRIEFTWGDVAGWIEDSMGIELDKFSLFVEYPDGKTRIHMKKDRESDPNLPLVVEWKTWH